MCFALLIIVLLAAWKIGRLLWRWNVFAEAPLAAAAHAGIGLLVISYVIAGLAWSHAVNAQALKVVAAALSMFAAWALLGDWKAGWKRLCAAVPLRSPGFWLFLVAAAVYAGWMLLHIQLPATARDELIYHLAVPKEILRRGGWLSASDNIYHYFPQLGEMYFLLALGVSGETAAKSFHLLWAVLLAVSFYGFARRYVKREFALLGLAILFTVPSVMVILPLAYVDLTYAFYAFLAVISVFDFLRKQEKEKLILAGIFTGAAACTKYTGIQLSLLLFALFLWQARQEKSVKKMFLGMTVPGLAFLLVAPYLLRNYLSTGWPLFPFYLAGFSLKEQAVNWDTERARLYLDWLGVFGVSFGASPLWSSLLAPFKVFLTGKFDSPADYEGIIGPVFLLAPLLFWKVKKEKDISFLGWFSVLFLYYWAFTTKQDRFLIPLLPVLSFLLVYGLAGRNRWICSGVLLLTLFNAFQGYGEMSKKEAWAYFSEKPGREKYLSRQLINYFMYQKTNQRLNAADRVYLINMKNYVYYLDAHWTADFVFERWRLDEILKSGDKTLAWEEFLKENKITHLLLDESFVFSPQWGLEGEGKEVFRAFLRDKTVPLVRYRDQTLYLVNSKADKLS